MNFINGPKDKYGNKKTVNLDQCTNVVFLTENKHGKTQYKIIFNMSYGVSIKENSDRIVPDYVYFIYNDIDEYNDVADLLYTTFDRDGWLMPNLNGQKTRRVANPRFISFINTDQNKNRIIINLATSISYYYNNLEKTSDYIYLDYDYPEEFEAEYQYLLNTLNTRN